MAKELIEAIYQRAKYRILKRMESVARRRNGVAATASKAGRKKRNEGGMTKNSLVFFDEEGVANSLLKNVAQNSEADSEGVHVIDENKCDD